MSRRIEIVDTCEHGEMNDHKVGPPVYVNPINIQERPECPGGSRTVLDPEEWVSRGADALVAHHLDRRIGLTTVESMARAVLESVLGDSE
jgi:hypothetical protein